MPSRKTRRSLPSASGGPAGEHPQLIGRRRSRRFGRASGYPPRLMDGVPAHLRFCMITNSLTHFGLHHVSSVRSAVAPVPHRRGGPQRIGDRLSSAVGESVPSVRLDWARAANRFSAVVEPRAICLALSRRERDHMVNCAKPRSYALDALRNEAEGEGRRMEERLRQAAPAPPAARTWCGMRRPD